MPGSFPEFGYNPVTGEWNDSLAGTFLWSSVNVSEAVPDVMTPSTWSLWWIYHFEINPIVFPGDHRFCGNICGRPYLNLSLLISLYQAVGMDMRNELQADMVGYSPAEIDIPIIPFSALSVLRTSLPGILKARLSARREGGETGGFLAHNPGWCRGARLAIQDCRDKAALLSLWQGQVKPAASQACRLLRGVTMNVAYPSTKLRRQLGALVGEADTNSILSTLSAPDAPSGLNVGLESLGPLVGLAQVRDGALSRESYLERYGHRGPHEMELFAPGAEDEPGWFEKQMAEFNRSAVDVNALLVKQRAEAAAAWARFESRFPGQSSATRRVLEKMAMAARLREQVRSELTRIARLVRAYLLRAGEITGLGDAVFFLSLDEMAGVLSGELAPLPRIPARRQYYQRCCELPPYPALIVGRFDPFAWAADPNRRGDLFNERRRAPASAPAVITGSAGGSGVVEGIVRRLDRPEEGSQLQQGEILVAVTTNVGWTPLFPRLSAIVTDVGAPLSHAAIVARELGIPAVVGCGNATMLLKTGDRVRVDGGRGTVEKIG